MYFEFLCAKYQRLNNKEWCYASFDRFALYLVTLFLAVVCAFSIISLEMVCWYYVHAVAI